VHYEHVAVGAADDLLGRAAQEDVNQSGAAVGRENDNVVAP